MRERKQVNANAASCRLFTEDVTVENAAKGREDALGIMGKSWFVHLSVYEPAFQLIGWTINRTTTVQQWRGWLFSIFWYCQ